MSSAKLEIANEVLRSFARNVTISINDKRRVIVSFPYRGESVTKQWMCRGQDFYPVWHRQLSCGGTAKTALSQLVRWVKGKPVLPIATWRYWASDTCRLLPRSAVDALETFGYPTVVDCVICGEEIAGILDWWSLDGLSGPCCGWTSGCSKKGKEVKP